jgi:hypothetical protein
MSACSAGCRDLNKTPYLNYPPNIFNFTQEHFLVDKKNYHLLLDKYTKKNVIYKEINEISDTTCF